MKTVLHNPIHSCRKRDDLDVRLRCRVQGPLPIVGLFACVIVAAAALTEQDLEPPIFTDSDIGVPVHRFNNGSYFSSLLLSEDGDKLYVGALEAIIALNASNITHELEKAAFEATELAKDDCQNKMKTKEQCHNYVLSLHINGSQLYACGTYAFDPKCAHFDLEGLKLNSIDSGQAKCPFDPEQRFTSVLSDGELYAGTTDDFFGLKAVIERTSSNRMSIRTVESKSWLHDPVFAGVDVVRGNATKHEGDEVIFFFSEMASEFSYISKPMVPRVARVCKDDIGGLRVLQKKWTTFVKSRLECGHGNKFPFTLLQDVSVMSNPDDASDTTFYTLLIPQWKDVEASAVCQYHLRDIQTSFSKDFLRYNDRERKWKQEKSGLQVHPGTCLSPKLHKSGYISSQDLPDDSLRYLQESPLLAGVVKPYKDKPLFVAQQVTYTRIAVEPPLRQHLKRMKHRIIYLGTDKGALHKVVLRDNGTHVSSKINLFNSAIKNIILAPSKGMLYVSSAEGVAQVPVVYCNAYNICSLCVKDPHCTWKETECIIIEEDRNSLQHSVETTCSHLPRGNEGNNARLQSDKDCSLHLLLMGFFMMILVVISIVLTRLWPHRHRVCCVGHGKLECLNSFPPSKHGNLGCDNHLVEYTNGYGIVTVPPNQTSDIEK
uniref:semaphorin-4D-like n=1 Tax=Myxine glutinosa TaxID=7769 RepID=UPI00358E0D3C